MKNMTVAIAKEYNKKETVHPMETILFTNESVGMFKRTPFRMVIGFFDLVAEQNKLYIFTTPMGVMGRLCDIKKAEAILINSIQNN